MKRHFEQKILPWQSKIYRFALSILKDEEWAKDAVQDVFIKVLESGEEWKSVQNHKPWLMRMTRNHCIDFLRCHYPAYEIQEQRQARIDIHKELEEKEMMQIIRELVEQLPEMQRTVMHLRDIEEFEIKEIAEIAGITENAVTVNLSRARQKIREKIGVILKS